MRSLAGHPLPLFLAVGVRYGIFTDDPWICTRRCRASMRAATEIGVAPDQLSGRVLAAADAAFAPRRCAGDSETPHQVGGVMIQIARTVAGPGLRYQWGIVLR